MSDLNYHHLRYFWAVAHDGNLTRTAERLNVSQSALSVQIKRLEERLGQKLFEKQGRGLVLTEAGRLALDHADAIFSTGEELLATLGHGRGPRRQVLRVGALATLSRNFQMAFLEPVLQRRDVEVVLRSGPLADLLAGLTAHRLDVVLVNTVPQRDAATPWIVRELDAQAISLVGTPGRVAGRRSTDLLTEEPVILPTIETAMRGDIDAWFAARGLVPMVAAEADDMAMIRLLARADAGLALVPPIVVRDELDNGRLVEVERLENVKEVFCAVTLERRFPNPVLAEVLRH